MLLGENVFETESPDGNMDNFQFLSTLRRDSESAVFFYDVQALEQGVHHEL